MYKYKIIEEVLYDKLHCKELVDLIFKYMYPIEDKHKFKIKKNIIRELSYFTIETLYLDGEIENEKKTISRCSICDRIIDTSTKFNFFGYLDCVNHLKEKHDFETNYNQTILNFISN